MRKLICILIVSVSLTAYAQVKEIRPVLIKPLYLSQAEYDSLTDADKDEYGESIKPYYWYTFDGENCSWYCSFHFDEFKITASSYLPSEGYVNYIPDNALDLNYKKVWAEGVDGDGIGEYLIYHLGEMGGEYYNISQIIVASGYVKDEELWKNNGRVKKLKVYIDNKPFAILLLEDIRSEQHFNVEPIFLNKKKQIKFEILEVYPGEKYSDTVISEIYFDGGGDH